VGHGEDEVQVRGGVVVGEDRALLAGGGPEVAAGGAEVPGGRQGGVEDVERVGPAVAVAVRRVALPRGRDELHGADGAVVHRVAVEHAVVGVADDRGPVPVEGDADDAPGGGPVGAQLGAAEPPVVRLHPADAGEQRPGEPAAGVELAFARGGLLIRVQCGDGDAVLRKRRRQAHVVRRGDGRAQRRNRGVAADVDRYRALRRQTVGDTGRDEFASYRTRRQHGERRWSNRG
jgi:hypothetical protein